MLYGVQGSECIQTKSVLGGATAEVLISRLVNATAYSITVAAVNRAGTGIGVYSNPITARTDGMHS